MDNITYIYVNICNMLSFPKHELPSVSNTPNPVRNPILRQNPVLQVPITQSQTFFFRSKILQRSPLRNLGDEQEKI